MGEKSWRLLRGLVPAHPALPAQLRLHGGRVCGAAPRLRVTWAAQPSGRCRGSEGHTGPWPLGLSGPLSPHGTGKATASPGPLELPFFGAGPGLASPYSPWPQPLFPNLLVMPLLSTATAPRHSNRPLVTSLKSPLAQLAAHHPQIFLGLPSFLLLLRGHRRTQGGGHQERGLQYPAGEPPSPGQGIPVKWAQKSASSKHCEPT